MLGSWVPTFFEEELGLPPVAASTHMMLLECSAVAGNLCVGKLFGLLIRRLKLTQHQTKRWSTFGVYVCQAVCLMTFSNAPALSRELLHEYGIAVSAATIATLAVCTRNMCDSIHGAYGFGNSYSELGGANTAVFAAVGNTLANCGSYVAPIVGAKLYQQTGSWHSVFISCAVVYVVVGVFYAKCIALRLPTTGDATQRRPHAD